MVGFQRGGGARTQERETEYGREERERGRRERKWKVRKRRVYSVSYLLDRLRSSHASHMMRTGVHLKVMTPKRFIALGY